MGPFKEITGKAKEHFRAARAGATLVPTGSDAKERQLLKILASLAQGMEQLTTALAQLGTAPAKAPVPKPQSHGELVERSRPGPSFYH
jgi:hypothetical protein